jgi:acetyl esterase
MTLDAQARLILDAVAQAEADGRPKFETLSAVEARRQFRETRPAVTPDPQDVAHVEDLVVDGPGGPIPVRAYRPAGSDAEASLPAVVCFHGGGWVFGDLDTYDVLCRQVTNASGGILFSVDYRMGPEDKFPAAVEDAYAVTNWVGAGAGGRAVDSTKIAVIGDSAGGNLAAVVALMARDGGPKLAFQGIFYGVTDMRWDRPSHREFAEGYLLSMPLMNWFLDQYLSDPADIHDWRASPLLADDHAGLPPAYILTAGYDPLRDEGKAYADRLAGSGAPVVYRCFEGQIHGFLSMGRIIDESATAISDLTAAMRRAFDGEDLT